MAVSGGATFKFMWAFEFSASPAGVRLSNGHCSYEGNDAYGMYLYYGTDCAFLSGTEKSFGYSVRCLKDSE